MMINVCFFVVVAVKEKFYQGKKMCFTLFPVSRNLIFAPLFKRNISRTFNFRLVKCAKKYNFAQPIVIRYTRKFSELRYIYNKYNLVN